jgi:hypothetical protein
MFKNSEKYKLTLDLITFLRRDRGRNNYIKIFFGTYYFLVLIIWSEKAKETFSLGAVSDDAYPLF